MKRNFYLLAVYYLILAINVVNHAIENPYRQPKFDKNTFASIEVSDNNFLFADQTIISYMDEILINTEKVGFIPNTPIIDFTGQSPGVLYLMKANAIGQPWMIGGLKGSDKLSYESLKLTSCASLKNSWLLIEPNGPRSINVNFLSYFGLDFYKDYKKVAEWETPMSLGGYTYVRNQILLEPNRDNSIVMKNCQNIE